MKFTIKQIGLLTTVAICASLTSCANVVTGQALSEDDKKYDYYYQNISKENQSVYEQLYEGLTSCQENIVLENAKGIDISIITEALCTDHPELAYFKGGGALKNIPMLDVAVFTPDYSTTNVDEALKTKERVKNFISNIADHTPKGSDYDKALYIYDYISDRTRFDKDTLGGEYKNIVSLIDNQAAVCDGYADATLMALHKVGIEAFSIMGESKVDDVYEAHKWICAKLDGEWCFIDTTWGDNKVNHYDYFGLTSEEINKDHFADKSQTIVPIPECTSKAANYYVRNNMILSGEEALELIYKLKPGEKLSFMCDSEESYNEIHRKFAEKGGDLYTQIAKNNGKLETITLEFYENDELHSFQVEIAK